MAGLHGAGLRRRPAARAAAGAASCGRRAAGQPVGRWCCVASPSPTTSRPTTACGGPRRDWSACSTRTSSACAACCRCEAPSCSCTTTWRASVSTGCSPSSGCWTRPRSSRSRCRSPRRWPRFTPAGWCTGGCRRRRSCCGDDGRPMLADTGVAALVDGRDRSTAPRRCPRPRADLPRCAGSGRARGPLATVLLGCDSRRRVPTACRQRSWLRPSSPPDPRRPSSPRPHLGGERDPAPHLAGPARSHRRRSGPIRRSSRRWAGLLVAVAAALAAALSGLAWAGVDTADPGSNVAAREPSSTYDVAAVSDRWRLVLVALDARRASAFAAVQPSALGRRLCDGSPGAAPRPRPAVRARGHRAARRAAAAAATIGAGRDQLAERASCSTSWTSSSPTTSAPPEARSWSRAQVAVRRPGESPSSGRALTGGSSTCRRPSCPACQARRAAQARTSGARK